MTSASFQDKEKTGNIKSEGCNKRRCVSCFGNAYAKARRNRTPSRKLSDLPRHVALVV